MHTRPRMTLVRMFKMVLAASLVFCHPAPAFGEAEPEGASVEKQIIGNTYVTIAGRQVAMWKPAGAGPSEGFPLVVFSHGFSLCETGSKFLTQSLAQAGYLVLAPHHRDGSCHLLIAKLFKSPDLPFGKPEAWSDTTHRDRRDDVEEILNEVLKEKSFQGVMIDRNRIGLAGHSLGGYTALGLAGAWPAWKDPRIKAVLAMAPYCAPFLKTGDLAHLNVPVMYQVATGDFTITPTVAPEGAGYDLTSAPKSLVEFTLVGHLAWTGAIPWRHDVIARYALAFFDHYLKGVSTPDSLAELFKSDLPSGVKRVDYNL